MAIRSQGASPNASSKNFSNMPVSDAELEQSGQPAHILKVLGDRSPGEGAFSKRLFPWKSYTLESALVSVLFASLPWARLQGGEGAFYRPGDKTDKFKIGVSRRKASYRGATLFSPHHALFTTRSSKSRSLLGGCFS